MCRLWRQFVYTCTKPFLHYDPKFTKKTVKHSPKVMVWVSFSWGKAVGIEFLGKGEMMTGVRYLHLLENKPEDKMKEAIARLWNVKMADSDYLRSLVESMLRRLAEVIERDGISSKY